MKDKELNSYLLQRLASVKDGLSFTLEDSQFNSNMLYVFAKVVMEKRDQIDKSTLDSFWNNWSLGEFNKEEETLIRYYYPIKAILEKPALFAHCLRTSFGIPFNVDLQKQLCTTDIVEGAMLDHAILDHDAFAGGEVCHWCPLYVIEVGPLKEEELVLWVENTRRRCFLESIFVPLILPQNSFFQISIIPKKLTSVLSSESTSNFLDLNFVLD